MDVTPSRMRSVETLFLRKVGTVISQSRLRSLRLRVSKMQFNKVTLKMESYNMRLVYYSNCCIRPL